ncbi:hypothetical protein LVY74_11725 [Acinetobacter sp. ME22]|uniref:hypothetical protein n=1 Tax=Acinetobacter sp. ME22 TaxID=2904802 RepID=UPI001EDAC774|nr:hypothetical protein [Acinetobacter sp. ME22]MCG2574219.1 hypothetical protein [Acinetobacter sp. ME22]
MPQIEYLQETHAAKVGEIHNVQEYEANVLIYLGIARLAVLLNPNGSAVIDDFGSLVALNQTADHPKTT